MADETLLQFIERHEGCRTTIYIDTSGVETIGIGHNLHKPLSRAAIEQIQRDDVNDAYGDCLHAFPWFAELTVARQWVLVDMCFNLGLAGLLKFKKFISAMALGDYETAAVEMLDSLWAKQVKGRALELANMIRGSVEV